MLLYLPNFSKQVRVVESYFSFLFYESLNLRDFVLTALLLTGIVK